MDMTKHDEYWKHVWDEARKRLDNLFSGCGTTVDEVIGDDGFIDSYVDAKKVLSYAMRCADSAEERSCATLSVFEALQALHELREHSVEAGA